MRRFAVTWRVFAGLLALCVVATFLVGMDMHAPSPLHRETQQLYNPTFQPTPRQEMTTTITNRKGAAAAAAIDVASWQLQKLKLISELHKPQARSPEQLLQEIGLANNEAGSSVTPSARPLIDSSELEALPMPEESSFYHPPLAPSANDNKRKVAVTIDTNGCMHTVESAELMTDDLGRTCLMAERLANGCCDTRNASRATWLSCHSCSLKETLADHDKASSVHRRCCARFEMCVSCCMRYTNENHYDHGSSAQAYRHCRTWCRTRGETLFDEEHQHFDHDYAQPQYHFCFFQHDELDRSMANHHLTLTRVLRRHLNSAARTTNNGIEYEWREVMRESSDTVATPTTTTASSAGTENGAKRWSLKRL